MIPALLLLTACDVLLPSETDPSRSFDRPAVQLGAVTATGSYSGGKPVAIALSSGALTKDVELSASFRLFFDRFLWPKTVIRQAVCLLPSDHPVASLADCTAPGQPFTEPEYNPVLREVIYRLPPGTRLMPSTQYRLTVFAPPCAPDLPAGQTCGPEAGSGFFAFDGAPLAQTYSFDFVTKDSGGQDEPAPSANGFCQLTNGSVPNAFAGPCGFTPCHSQRVSPTFSIEPPMGLNLSSPAYIAATAIGAPAHETQTGEDAIMPDVSGARFGRAMPIIDPSSPGTSYLIYKLLANAQNYNPSQLNGTNLPDEIERLRRFLVVGLPMPATSSINTNSQTGGTSIDPNLVQQFSDWIASGAPVTCPAAK